jgi:hypothetical protein
MRSKTIQSPSTKRIKLVIPFKLTTTQNCISPAANGIGYSVNGQMTISAELLDLNNLGPSASIDVETKSRHYKIECLDGNAIRISGHPEYCPEPVPAWLHGSIDREGVLEFGMIGRGMRLVFLLDEPRRPVTTSKVLHVHVRPQISG